MDPGVSIFDRLGVVLWWRSVVDASRVGGMLDCVRFSDEEFVLVQEAADEVGVTPANLVAESAVAAAQVGRVSVDAQVLDELRAIRRLLQAYGGLFMPVAARQSDEPDRSQLSAAERALGGLGDRITALLDDLEHARVQH
jgi:hypothetical protein